MVLIVVKSRWKWLKVCGWPSSPTTVAADVNTPLVQPLNGGFRATDSRLWKTLMGRWLPDAFVIGMPVS